MDGRQPRWYNNASDSKEASCCSNQGHPNSMCCYNETFRDRICNLAGTEVVLSVDASICGNTTLTGTLCYVGQDFIILSLCVKKKVVSLNIPISMIKFIASN